MESKWEIGKDFVPDINFNPGELKGWSATITNNLFPVTVELNTDREDGIKLQGTAVCVDEKRGMYKGVGELIH